MWISESFVDREDRKSYVSLRSRLLRSHLLVALCGVFALCVNFGMALWNMNRTLNLAQVSAPTAVASVRVLTGLQRSLAALRGWIAIGSEDFRLERRYAWESDIDPTLAQLMSLSERWDSAEERELLAQSIILLTELRKLQAEIEESARSIDADRARTLLQERAVPLGEKASSHLRKLASLQQAQMESDSDILTNNILFEATLAAGLIVITVLMAFAVSARKARGLASPITILADAVTRFQETRQMQLVDVSESSELGRLSGAFLALQDEVLRTESDLNMGNEQLLRSNAELEKFAAAASHELQEPLRMVTGYTRLLKKRYGDKLELDAVEFLDFALDGATRMQRLVEELLELSRAGNTTTVLEPVQSGEPLENALKNLQVSIEEKQAKILKSDDFPVVRGHKGQLTQLFQNLIGNALKYCREEQPQVQIEVKMTEDGRWLFSVSDNGLGFDMADAKRIFSVFERLHGTQDEFRGAGIGLSLCHKIVEYHGGEIWAESEQNIGSTFFFTLWPIHPD